MDSPITFPSAALKTSSFDSLYFTRDTFAQDRFLQKPVGISHDIIKVPRAQSMQGNSREMKKAFTLIEILIIVAFLGILAAIVLPTLQGQIQKARESTAKDDLRILRNTIEVYAAKHNDVPPGYIGNNPSSTPFAAFLRTQLVMPGHYLPEIPENPFNNKSDIKMIDNVTGFPAAPVETGTYGWIYKPKTKKIRLNWPGIDSAGVAYFNY